ncbi:hypothetical protein DBR11_04990 [Pedobacter sp. HMWF019]|uniref:DUF6266 family protein n=1 Tax=Pedobacter sp. HMWF019 TaxID=2056856 RepID=UPI000D39AAE1|nr:DUF6266 family protein [Pedobacter sp. HMWF019]PTT02346.1 hypothetical protein DBR11_04990 [Pedobacter sp. HMWF019]
MARLTKGLFSALTGICGGVEVYQSRGQVIVRSCKRKSTKPASIKQLASRQKMAVVNQFLGSITPFIKSGFAGVVTGKAITAYNAAVAYQLRNGVMGAYPAFALDYTRLRVCEGPLVITGSNAAVTLNGDDLVFNWSPVLTYPHCNDHVLLLAYAPALQQGAFNLCGAKRSTGLEVLPLPDQSWTGQVLETYLAFMEENSLVCSNSVYTGRL